MFYTIGTCDILSCETQTMKHLHAPLLVHEAYYGLAFMSIIHIAREEECTMNTCVQLKPL